jgi:hypothetical protein
MNLVLTLKLFYRVQLKKTVCVTIFNQWLILDNNFIGLDDW